MGLLDDLKQKADQARLEKEREEARRAELERIYREGTRPAMLKIYNFLVEMTGLLTEPVFAGFDFPGIGRVEKLEQTNYNIQIDSQREPKLITLRFDCVAKDERRYTVYPKSAGDEACQFLTENKVVFSDWAVRDAGRQTTGMVIQCKLRVPVALAFEADIEKGGIRVMSHHYGGAAEKNFLAKPDSIDEGWLDKLGYFILRQGDSFGTLSLSDCERDRIRLLVEEQKRKSEGSPAESGQGQGWLGGVLNKPFKKK